MLATDPLALPYIIESRPSPEFSYEAGKNKLINLDLSTDGGLALPFITPGDDDPQETYQTGNEAGFTGRHGKFVRLSTWVDMESRLTIGCAGALLTYIGRRKAIDYLPNDGAADRSFSISSVETFNLKGTMYVFPDLVSNYYSSIDWTPGLSTQTLWHPFKFCTQSPAQTHTAKDQQGWHQDQRKVYPSMAFSTILLEHHRVSNFFDDTSYGLAWIWS